MLTPSEKMPLPETTPQSAEITTLRGVSWKTYESLLQDFADNSVPHLTYDRGTLETISPLRKHEVGNRALAGVVEIVAEEWEVDTLNFGSTTFRREDLDSGFEPDTAFYIQNARVMFDKDDVDLLVNPAPDLVIEVEETRSALAKLPLFLQFGVPEVWRVRKNGTVEIHVLQNGAYQIVQNSAGLPLLTRAVLETFIAQSTTLRRLEWRKTVREWAQTQGKTS